MRPKGLGKQELEIRRRTAVALVTEHGLSHREAASAVGAVPSSVSVWVNAWRSGGHDALNAKPEPKTRRRRLSESQRKKLAAMLIAGPRRFGFSTELWTLSRIKQLIARQFGEEFSIGHLHRIVRELGFSAQKPERRAREQDVRAVREFRERTWPALGKERGPRGEHSS